MERPRTLGSYLRALALYRGRLLAITALVALAALGFKGWRLYTRVQALREDVRAIETIAPAKPDTAMPSHCELKLRPSSLSRGDSAGCRSTGRI